MMSKETIYMGQNEKTDIGAFNRKIEAYNKVILDNQMDEALSMIEELIIENPADDMNYVKKFKLLNYMGLTQKADLHFLKEIGHFERADEDIIANWISVEWVPELLKYVPEEYEKKLKGLCQYAKWGAIGDRKGQIQEISRWIEEIINEVSRDEMFYIIYLIQMKATDETYKLISPIVTKLVTHITKLLKEKRINKQEKIHYKYLEDVFSLFFIRPEQIAMKLMSEDNTDIGELYTREEFRKLGKGNRVKTKDIEESIYNIEKDFFDDVLRHFGLLRSSTISPKIANEIMDFGEKYRCNIPTVNWVNRSFCKMLLMIMYVECALYCQEEEKAIDYLLETKYEVSDAFGLYSYDLIRYGKQIMAFYEAWIKKNSMEIEELLPEIERTQINWLRDLAKKVMMQLTETEHNKEGYHATNVEAMLYQIKDSMSTIKVQELSKAGMADELEKLLKGMPKQEIRIAITGETSAGKSTFLNRLFNTELFFTTQEEATGVPTEIRKGKDITVEVFNHKGEIRSAYQTTDGTWIDRNREEYLEERKELERKREEDYQKRLKKYNSLWNKFLRWCGKKQEEIKREVDELMTPEEFILKHSRVGEEALGWIEKVCVTLPIQNMPNNIVIIDTPGFNANTKRADIAKKVIVESHVGMFVIDARNALKKEEMKVAKFIQSEVSKMIFIVNKVDNIDIDDDLDCDEEDSIEDRIEYMKHKISDELRSQTIEIWPVCSLPKSEVKNESKKYCENIQIIKEVVLEAIQRQRIELVIDQVAKQVETLISQVEQYAEETIIKLTTEVAELEESTYIDPELLRDDILEKGHELYAEEVDNYVTNIQNDISRHLTNANNQFTNWLKQVETKDELREHVKNKASYRIQEAASDIERNRKKELQNLSGKMQVYLHNVFEQLYEKLDISLGDSKKFDGNAAYLNHRGLSVGRFSANELGESISRAQSTASDLLPFFSNDTRKLVGSGIAKVYKFTDKLIGKSLQQLIQETSIQFAEQLNHVEKQICDVYSKDLDQDEQSSYMNKFQDYIEEEIECYEHRIQEKIMEVKNRWIYENKEIILLKKKIYYMQVKMNQVNIWRQNRKSE